MHTNNFINFLHFYEVRQYYLNNVWNCSNIILYTGRLFAIQSCNILVITSVDIVYWVYMQDMYSATKQWMSSLAAHYLLLIGNVSKNKNKNTAAGLADLNQGDLNQWFKSNDFFAKKITCFKSYNYILLKHICNN